MFSWLFALAAFAQSETFAPGLGEHGTLLFEDTWPCPTDRDFNDVVVDWNLVRRATPTGAYELVYSLDVQAMGASECSGLGLVLPVANGSIAHATLELGTPGSANGTPWSAPGAVPRSADGGTTVLTISEDLRADLCGAEGFLNTDPALGVVDCAPMTVRVSFTTPQALPTDAPGDLFIFRCDDPALQVHRSGYPGTSTATGHGTCADESEVGGPWYVSGGVPYALNLGEGLTVPFPEGRWPEEHVAIEAAFPRILVFATGSGGDDFYYADVTPDLVYAGAVQDAPIAAAPVPASCDALKASLGVTTSDAYLVAPTGSPYAVRCDLEYDDGGWTLVGLMERSLSGDNGFGDAFWYRNGGQWTNTSFSHAMTSDVGATYGDDAKGRAWTDVAGTRLRWACDGAPTQTQFLTLGAFSSLSSYFSTASQTTLTSSSGATWTVNHPTARIYGVSNSWYGGTTRDVDGNCDALFYVR